MRILLNILIILISFSLQAENILRPGITINTQNEVRANAPVLLKELASFDFVSPELAKKAGDLVVYESLEEGLKLNIKNIDFLKIVRNKLGSDAQLSTLAWTYFVPENVNIKVTKNYLNPNLVSAEIISNLQKKCVGCTITLKDLTLPVINEKNEIKHFEIDYESLKLGGSFLISVITNSNVPKKVYWISGNSKISKLGPVATRQLSVGDRITSKDFKMDQVDITFAKDGVPSSDELNNQVINKFVSINQPIFKSDIRRELAVKRGQTIKMIVGTDDFEISTQGTADDQGYVGDVIKLKNIDNQKVLMGKIVEPGIVRVQ